MTQKVLADAAGISRVAVSKIEKAESTPRVGTLKSIASALGVSVLDLVTPVPRLENIRFRSRKTLKVRDGVIAEAAKALEDYSKLESLLGEQTPFRLDGLLDRSAREPKPSKRLAERVARKARKEVGLEEDEIIRDICGLLEEKAGVKVLVVPRASDAFFGLSVADEELGCAVVVNTWDRISVERWIFTAAHELGHLILHPDAYNADAADEPDDEEQEADWFASEFLMPQKLFLKEWSDTSGRDLVSRVLKVKRIFRVSYKTVLHRVKDISSAGDGIWRIFNNAYYKKTGKRLRLKDEPEPLGRQEFSESLRSKEPEGLSTWDLESDRRSLLVRKAIEKHKITVSRGAEIMGISVNQMRDLMKSWLDEG